MKSDYQVLEFKNSGLWRQWLDKNSQSVNGIWLKIYKKASGVESVNYSGALEEALCYGWIDGQLKKLDELAYLQKFTPRRPKSMWSKRNIEYVAKLETAGLMMPPGQQEVEMAKADGRWSQAYDKPSDMTVPEDFLKELQKHPKAKEFFLTLNKANTYAIAWRLRTAKTEETRRRRQDKILELLNAGQKLH